MEMWGGDESKRSVELGLGNGIECWDCTTEYFTVGVKLLLQFSVAISCCDAAGKRQLVRCKRCAGWRQLGECDNRRQWRRQCSRWR